MGLRVVLASPGAWALARRVAKILVGCALGGTLILAAFVASFYVAMRVEMRSTEVQVPDLTGLTLEEAALRAQPSDLALQIMERRHDPAVPSERVLEQAPRAGDRVRRGRKIKLVMSLGGEVLEIPTLVGRAARTVEIELRRGGFAPGFEVRVPSRAEAGMVLAQVPPAGTPSVPNSRVHRLVSDGPAQPVWVMPDLSRATRASVERWARRAGVRLAVRGVGTPGRTSGTVVGQLPPAGHPVRASEVVELTVAR